MIVDLGYFCLVLAFSLAGYAQISGLLGIFQNSANLIRSSFYSSILLFFCVLVAYLVLTHAFLVSDFSLRFVANNSSTDLPLFYKITAVWGGMDGSLLLWTMLLSGYGFVVVLTCWKKKNCSEQYATIFINFILFFLLFLLIGWSNPLARNFPIPSEGQGLNPVLQDIAMAVHPPMLYLGFIGLSIPFAFGMASLLSGKLDSDWIRQARRWTLVAWLFLTAGIILGGQWAYYELGWGGYWAWDPVENSSLLPWLTATAFLHSAMVQEKREVLKIWNYILIIITFSLTIIGTFITRSGVLNSVHAFAQSNIGPAFLVFVTITFLLCFSLLFYRLPLLENKTKIISLFCKENVFLLNNIFLVGIAFTVFYGTIFPLIAEALASRKISVQAPFFNQVSLPFVMLLLILMGIAPFLAWSKASITRIRSNLWLPVAVSLGFMIICGLFLTSDIQFILLAGVVYFAAHAVLLEMFKIYTSGYKRMKKHKRTWQEIFKDRRGWGAMITHLGVIVFFVGVLGNFLNQEKTKTFQVGEKLTIQNYQVHYTGVELKTEKNTQLHIANFQLFKNGKFIQNMQPAKAFYLFDRWF